MKKRIDYRMLMISAVLLSVLINGCIPQKKITYFQQKSDTSNVVTMIDTAFIAVINSNDIVNIFVTSVNPEATRYFNYVEKPELMYVNPSFPGANGYLVDAYGYIHLPLIGAIKIGGLGTNAAIDTITRKLSKYIESPTVKLNIQNFRVTVLGEVSKPGVYYMSSEKMTITEALAQAGDLTQYGMRSNVMVIREKFGKKNFATIDITSREVFNSSYYYLQSNDIIYVEPMKAKKLQVESWNKILPLGLSTLSMILVLISFLKK